MHRPFTFTSKQLSNVLKIFSLITPSHCGHKPTVETHRCVPAPRHRSTPNLSLILPLLLPLFLPLFLSPFLPLFLSPFLPLFLSPFLPLFLSLFLPLFLPLHFH